MTVTIKTADELTPGFDFAAAGDVLIISSGVTFFSTTGAAISEDTEIDVSAIVNGTVIGGGTTAISITGRDSDVLIGTAGLVTAESTAPGDAVVIVGGVLGSTFTNYGLVVTATNAAVSLTGQGMTGLNAGVISGGSEGLQISGPQISFINSGTIAATAASDDARAVEMTAGGAFRNDGTIQSLSGYGFYANVISGDVDLINTGRILAPAGNAVLLGAGKDTLRNEGLIDGQVQLALGNDSYDGTSGRVMGDVEGSFGADTLTGGSFRDVFLGGSGNDLLSGGAGNDRITGGTGRDRLTGGTGSDAFVFEARQDSGTASAARDVIADFRRGQDKIDLSQIDAIGGGLDNAFRFIGARDFTAEGQVHVIQRGGQRWVELNMDGDRAAEFRLVLSGTGTLGASDFIL